MPNKQTLVLGDLHGNSLKFFHALVRFGIITVPKKEYEWFSANYTQACSSYLFSDNPKDNVDNMVDVIIGKCTVNPKNIEKLVIIGDELADRGINDFITLKMMEALKNGGVEMVIMTSNHSIDAINTLKAADGETGLRGVKQGKESRSLDMMLSYFESKPGSKEQATAIMKQAYLPCLKLIHSEFKDGELYIYSHAPIDVETVKCIADKMGVPWQGGLEWKDGKKTGEVNLQGVHKTIEAINDKYQALIEENNFFNNKQYYDPNKIEGGMTGDKSQAPLEMLFWNRELNTLTHEPGIINVHGHTTGTQAGWINTDDDNLLGKADTCTEGHLGHWLSKPSNTPTLWQDDNNLLGKADNCTEGHLGHWLSKPSNTPTLWQRVLFLGRSLITAVQQVMNAIFFRSHPNKNDLDISAEHEAPTPAKEVELHTTRADAQPLPSVKSNASLVGGRPIENPKGSTKKEEP